MKKQEERDLPVSRPHCKAVDGPEDADDAVPRQVVHGARDNPMGVREDGGEGVISFGGGGCGGRCG